MRAFLCLTFSLCAAATGLDEEEQQHQTCLLQTAFHLGQDTAPSGEATSREARRHGLQKLWRQVRGAFEPPAATGEVLLTGELGRVSLAAIQGGLEGDAQADQQRLDAAFARMDALSGAVADYASYAAERVSNASVAHGGCRNRELRLRQSLRDCDGASCRRGLSEELSFVGQACGVLQLELEWTACNLTSAALYSPAAVAHEYRDAVDQYTALEMETDAEQVVREMDSARASQLGCLQGKMRAAPRQPLSQEWLDQCSLAASAEVAAIKLRHETPPPLAALPHQPCTEEFILEHYAALAAGVQLDACRTCQQIEQSQSALAVAAAAEEWQRRQGPLPPAAAALAIA